MASSVVEPDVSSLQTRWIKMILRTEQDLLAEMHPHINNYRIESPEERDEDRRKRLAAAARYEPAAEKQLRRREQEQLLQLIQQLRKQVVAQMLE